MNRVEQRLSGRDDYGSILWVDVREWPEDDQAAYLSGDPATRSALIERHCGRRPAVTGARGPIRTVVDLPPMPMHPEPAVAEAERTGGDIRHLRPDLLLANETDVGAAHDGMEPCRAGLLANVDQLNR